MTALTRIAWGFFWLSLTPLWPGTIQGEVTDRLGTPVSDVLIWLKGDGKEEQTLRTDGTGLFQFPLLEQGWYSLGIVEPIGYGLVSPPCGYHRFYVGDPEIVETEFILESRGSGVVVEFGRPNGAETDGITILSGNTFNIGVFAYQLTSFFPLVPDRLVIRGNWYLLGAGALQVELVGGQAAGAYLGNGLEIFFQNSNGSRVEIELRRTPWPHLNQDGEMATLSFQIVTGNVDISLAGKTVVFCMDDVSLYWRSSPLQRNPSYFIESIK